jgi:hypothetical protein
MRRDRIAWAANQALHPTAAAVTERPRVSASRWADKIGTIRQRHADDEICVESD